MAVFPPGAKEKIIALYNKLENESFSAEEVHKLFPDLQMLQITRKLYSTKQSGELSAWKPSKNKPAKKGASVKSKGPDCKYIILI